MEAFGIKTVFEFKGIKTTFGDSDDTEFSKILQKKEKSKPADGNIYIELKNGIISLK
ncbi:MAG: hypothetical protein HC798_04510 [Polaribacter sp.]|nr:hypothetical protein [Polaribacter sp.]